MRTSPDSDHFAKLKRLYENAPVSRWYGVTIHVGARLLFAEAHLYDEADRLLAQGSGTFARSSIPLDARVGYA